MIIKLGGSVTAIEKMSRMNGPWAFQRKDTKVIMEASARQAIKEKDQSLFYALPRQGG